MSYFKKEGIKIHYEIFGDGKPFVFLHGLGGDLNQPVTHFKKRKDIKLITIELRGNGETSTGKIEDLSFDKMAEDVKDICDYLNLKSIYIGGISMGAAVSMNFAIKYGYLLKSLILIRIAWLDRPMENLICNLYDQVAENIILENGKEIFKKSEEYRKVLTEAPATADAFTNYFDNPVSKKTFEKFVKLPKSKPIESLNILKEISVTTLIIATKQDPLHPFDYGKICSDLIPNSEFYEAVSKSKDREYHIKQVKNRIDKFITDVESSS